jgi:hypothetical protein
MEKPIIRIYTTADEFIDREMDDAEFAQYQTDYAAAQAELVAVQIKASERQALLARLGITEDEARLLLG